MIRFLMIAIVVTGCMADGTANESSTAQSICTMTVCDQWGNCHEEEIGCGPGQGGGGGYGPQSCSAVCDPTWGSPAADTICQFQCNDYTDTMACVPNFGTDPHEGHCYKF